MITQASEPPLEPLILMPAAHPCALRTAVEKLTPSRVPASVQDLVGATTNVVQRVQSLAPLRAFVHTQGAFIAIQRTPFRAARPRLLEKVVNTGAEDPAEATAEMRRIRAEAGL